jgi:hypothetical protein
MVYHYPKTFWGLLGISYGMIIAACYAWVASKNWPYAASALGSMLLITFMLVSISFVSREQIVNGRAIEGILQREGKGYTRQGGAPIPDFASDPAMPIPPVVIKAEADPVERNKLIAQNTAELQKNTATVHEATKRLGGA